MDCEKVVRLILQTMFSMLICIESVKSRDCYQCTYSVIQGTVVSGSSKGCRDVLRRDNQVSQMQCTGTCFTSYKKKSNVDITYIRGCSQDCKPMTGQKEWRKCCTEELCNSSPSSYSTWRSIPLLSVCLIFSHIMPIILQTR